MHDKLRTVTEELDRALLNHEAQSIPRLTVEAYVRAEYPDWTMPEAKPEDVRVADRMVSTGGHVSTVLSVQNGYWRMSDPPFPHSSTPFTLLSSGEQVPYWTLPFTGLGKSRKLLPRGGS